MITLGRVVLLFAMALLVPGCSGGGKVEPGDTYRGERSREAPEQHQEQQQQQGRSASSPSAAATKATSPSGFATKVKFKGRENFSIKPMSDGAKLVDAADLELARYKVRDEFRVKVKDRSDRELGQIKGDAAKMHVENASGVRIFALQRQTDGDYKLEGANGELLYKIKKREYGLKIVDAQEVEVAKVKVKEGKTSLRDASDETILSTKDSISELAMGCLALQKIDRPLRVALAIRIQAEGK